MASEKFGNRHCVPLLIDGLTLAHQDEGAMREWREVAAATERPELAHNWNDSGIQDRGHGLGNDGAHTGATRCERLEAQDHKRANNLSFDRGTHSCGV
jgi:hypothetical protein